ncbi:hypothetical protein ACU4GD_31815 [Cupriavidus basilensis]
MNVLAQAEAVEAAGHGRSIWIGEHAVLDAAARTVSATDARGQRYGQVRGGGSIVIGGEIDPATGTASAGNCCSWSCAKARYWMHQVPRRVSILRGRARSMSPALASISLASNHGLYLNGNLKAAAGGAGAARHARGSVGGTAVSHGCCRARGTRVSSS